MKEIRKKKVNFEKAKSLATQYLEIHDIQYFPIDILEILKDYDNLSVQTYEDISKKTGISIDQVIKNCGSTEGALTYDSTRDFYIISYNDKVTRDRPNEMIYWTLCHEFAHFVLQHNKEKGVEVIARVNLEEKKFDPYETEANFFTRFFVSPPAVIIELEMFNKHKIKNYFGVSAESANYTLNYIQKSKRDGYAISLSQDFKIRFKKFIQNILNGKTCNTCNSFFVIKDTQYCPICGQTTFKKNLKGEDIDMKYPGIEVDNQSRALICPTCHNEELRYDGDICMICKSDLVNKCADKIDYDVFNEEQYIQEKSCGTILPGNARYCFKCGKESTFYQRYYIRAWNQDEIDAQKEAEALVEAW